MQYSGNNEDQVRGLGEEYIEDSSNGYDMLNDPEILKSVGNYQEPQQKIIAEAQENGYGAEYREDLESVVIESDKNFKMTVPVIKNHAVRFINVTTEHKKKMKQDEMKDNVNSIIQNAVQKSEGDENKQVGEHPYVPRYNLPVPAEVDVERGNNESQEYEYINSEKESSKGDIYINNDKESNNNESKKSQNSINSKEYSIEEF